MYIKYKISTILFLSRLPLQFVSPFHVTYHIEIFNPPCYSRKFRRVPLSARQVVGVTVHLGRLPPDPEQLLDNSPRFLRNVHDQPGALPRPGSIWLYLPKGGPQLQKVGTRQEVALWYEAGGCNGRVQPGEDVRTADNKEWLYSGVREGGGWGVAEEWQGQTLLWGLRLDIIQFVIPPDFSYYIVFSVNTLI